MQLVLLDSHVKDQVSLGSRFLQHAKSKRNRSYRSVLFFYIREALEIHHNFKFRQSLLTLLKQ